MSTSTFLRREGKKAAEASLQQHFTFKKGSHLAEHIINFETYSNYPVMQQVFAFKSVQNKKMRWAGKLKSKLLLQTF